MPECIICRTEQLFWEEWQHSDSPYSRTNPHDRLIVFENQRGSSLPGLQNKKVPGDPNLEKFQCFGSKVECPIFFFCSQ